MINMEEKELNNLKINNFRVVIHLKVKEIVFSLIFSMLRIFSVLFLDNLVKMMMIVMNQILKMIIMNKI